MNGKYDFVLIQGFDNKQEVGYRNFDSADASVWSTGSLLFLLLTNGLIGLNNKKSTKKMRSQLLMGYLLSLVRSMVGSYHDQALTKLLTKHIKTKKD